MNLKEDDLVSAVALVVDAGPETGAPVVEDLSPGAAGTRRGGVRPAIDGHRRSDPLSARTRERRWS